MVVMRMIGCIGGAFMLAVGTGIPLLHVPEETVMALNLNPTYASLAFIVAGVLLVTFATRR